MPTYSTISTPRTGDAAGPGRDGPIPLDKSIPQSIASDNDPIGLPARSTRNVLNLLKKVWHLFQAQRECDRLRVIPSGMSERELQDIGMTRTEIEYVLARRTLDKLRDHVSRIWML